VKSEVRDEGTPSAASVMSVQKPGASFPRVRRPATKKVDDFGSGTDGVLLFHVFSDSARFIIHVDTPPPTRPLQDRNDDNHSPDIRELVDSGRYTLAPAHPVITRPFPVQPIPKAGHSYATAPPLDRTPNRARHWELATREIRTIAGGSWKARTWMGGTSLHFFHP
jgi:hypothetical protein